MRRYSQEEINSAADGRGVVPSDMAVQIRQLRAGEPWERYDSIVVGEGAADRSRGWFNTWADLARADELQWFGGRDSNVGPAYTNQRTERTDWAQDLYQTCVEFFAPTGFADFELQANDAQFSPAMFTQLLPQTLALKVTLAESDEIARAPSTHFPAGFGTTGTIISGAAAPAVVGGNNGESHVSNSFKWPEPVMLAAKAKLTVTGQIDAPLRNFLLGLPGPGSKSIPGAATNLENWYVIRITFRGPRFLQLRGARSSA